MTPLSDSHRAAISSTFLNNQLGFRYSFLKPSFLQITTLIFSVNHLTVHYFYIIWPLPISRSISVVLSMICVWNRIKWSLLNWSIASFLCYGIFSLIFLLSRLFTDTFVLYLLIYGSLFILYRNLIIIINNIFVVKNEIKLRVGRERERQRNLTA
jgi:hypothetical protein